MDISIFGLGYVGTVTAAGLARNGHRVVGVDVAQAKVDSLNEGRSPIVEPELDVLIAEAAASGCLRATTDYAQAIAETDLALVCVGTPSSDNGSLSVDYVERVMAQIGTALRTLQKETFLIVLRSTVLPGTTRTRVLPILEQTTERPAGQGYDVVFHPEFLREGSSIRDFFHPPKIVVGEYTPGTAQPLLDLYEGMQAKRFVTSLEVAEMVKYADNAFHAVKITFANEIGQFCRAAGIDSRVAMELFCADTQLNISPAYLRPGFAFGGSCLPKDLRAITHAARHRDLHLPLLTAVLPSNSEQIERVLQRIQTARPAQIGLVGLAFKPHTDDLRESPMVTLAERLLGKGHRLHIYDEHVQHSQLVGRNRAYIDLRLPHLSSLLVTSLGDLAHCDLIVLGHPLAEPEWLSRWLEDGKRVLDLTGKCKVAHANYEGLYW